MMLEESITAISSIMNHKNRKTSRNLINNCNLDKTETVCVRYQSTFAGGELMMVDWSGWRTSKFGDDRIKRRLPPGMTTSTGAGVQADLLRRSVDRRLC